MASADSIYALDIQARDSGSPVLMALTAARVRVDTYVPNNHVITFKLKISRFVLLIPTVQLYTCLANAW